MRRLRLSLLALAAAAAACKQPEPPPPPPAAPAAPPAPAQVTAVTGKVLERLDAEPYSYLRLEPASGELWAAVPKTDVAKGAEVTVAQPMPMDGFESKTLKRKFERIVFGTLAGQGAAAPAGAPLAAGPAAPGAAPLPGALPTAVQAQHAAAAAGPADVGDVKVEKAKGGDARSVAEVFAQKAALRGKTVAVRGKVVKFSPGIMGRNWVHLRDGTGGQGANDLTVTTGESASVGEVVTAKGKVATDRNFGSGYTYPVLLEEAKLAR